MSGLPCGWARIALDELIVPRSDRVSPQGMPDVKFIGMEHVEPHTNRIIETVPASTMASNAARFFAGDVLYGRMRPYLSKVVSPAFDGLASAEFIVFPRSDAIDAQFLLWRLSSSDFTQFACSQYEGDRPRVKFDQLGKFDVLLPPRAEQTRIVEKLEDLLGSLDAAVAELKAAQRKLAHYRQSLLKAAMEGALTEAWRSSHSPCPRSGQGEVGRGSLLPSDKSTPPQPSPSPSAKGREQETGTQLLHRILQERRTRWEAKQQAKFAQTGKTPPKGWQAKYPEPVAPDTSELPALPGGWVWATIDQLAHVGTGVTPLRSKRAYFDGGSIPWTTSGALNDELVETASEHVTQLALEGCRLEIYPAGSLLVAMYGEGKTRGKCAELGFPSTINQAIAAIVFEGAAVAVRSHVKTVLLDAYEAMRKQASGGVQPNLNLQIIKAFPVPLPPLEEQTAILATLDTQLSAAKEQEAAITHALHQAAAQRRNLLRAAFSGQLVPQDPNDEPASALLARIRAARADNAKPAAATKRGRKSKGNT